MLQMRFFSHCSFEQDGVTPLSEAARNGNSEIVGYLLEKNVPIKMNMVCVLNSLLLGIVQVESYTNALLLHDKIM